MSGNGVSSAEYGILTLKLCRELFERINKRPLCNRCQSERSRFSIKDKKGHPSYSNLLPGFSSKTITIPVDILIIAEAHGGGREEDFHPQKPLDFEVSWLANYYRWTSLKKFHQQQVRDLLQSLDQADKSWVFTDLIKCFVWRGVDKSKGLDGRINGEIAVNHCRKYLNQQIRLLQPRKILVLGRTVAQKYFGLQKSEHASIHQVDFESRKTSLVYSVFPARNTADLWVERGAWRPVVQRLFHSPECSSTF